MNETLIVVMPDGFDLNLATAAQTIRWGYYHGAIQAGLSSRFVEYVDLLEVEAGENPIFWLTYDDFRFLGEPVLRMLRKHPHIVEVNTWFDGMERLHRHYDAPSPTLSSEVRQRIQESNPSFVWCSAPEAYLEFYAGWHEAGMNVVSLPWACDTDRYYPVGGSTFSDVEIAFVGGYRDYKEPQYAERLWPYEDRLRVWGYSVWPRCYQGYLQNGQEKALYSQARLCPTLSEPQFFVTGDTVERPFKVMGCRGLTILDMPCYHDLFSTDEALIIYDPEMYHWLVGKVLEDDVLCAQYREAGYRAVLERHTYVHRVKTILKELGI